MESVDFLRNLWAGKNVCPVMTCQVINITHLKWSAGLFLLLLIAACGTSAPSQSVSSIPGASSQSQLAQAPVVMNEAPVAAITPSPDHSTTDNPSGIWGLDVHSASIEATLKSVVLTPTLDPDNPYSNPCRDTAR